MFASSLRGEPVVGPDGQTAGHLRDIVIKVDGDGLPPVVGLVIQSAGHRYRIHTAAMEVLDHQRIAVRMPPHEHKPFARDNGEMLVIEDLFDAEVVDRKSVRVLRVNDVRIETDNGVLKATGIDASGAGLWRRLVPHSLARTTEPKSILPWEQIEPMVDDVPGVEFRLKHSSLAELHPSEIAKLIAHLPYRQGSKILCCLTDAMAADTLEEVEKHRQPEILEYLPTDRAVSILNMMAPDAAADLLQQLLQQDYAKLLPLLAPETASDVRLLLSYPHDSAGGIMTTDFVIAMTSESVSEALTTVKAQLLKPDLVYYIYIVDDAEDRNLKGVISLRDLLLADPATLLSVHMQAVTQSVQPERHCKEVAQIMGEYNLLALPVTDQYGRMLGLVTADDVLDLMLPEQMRQHLPRLFS